MLSPKDHPYKRAEWHSKHLPFEADQIQQGQNTLGQTTNHRRQSHRRWDNVIIDGQQSHHSSYTYNTNPMAGSRPRQVRPRPKAPPKNKKFFKKKAPLFIVKMLKFL